MQQVLPDETALNIIADMYETDPNYSVQHVGAMEVHEGRHPSQGRILVFREISTGRAVVAEKPRPTLKLVS